MWVGFRRPDAAIYFVGEGGIYTPDMLGEHMAGMIDCRDRLARVVDALKGL